MPPILTVDLVAVLSTFDDVGHITHHELAEPSSRSHVLEAEVQDRSAQAVLRALAGHADFQAVEIYLRPIQDVEHYRFERGRPVAIEDEADAINISVGSRDPLGAIPDRLTDFVTIVDGVTITVALGAGVGAMVVFVSDRRTAAVGVGVSITTIPAAAYAGIAFADGNWSSGSDALVVLGVNIVCVIAAGVMTGLVLRRHLEHRARAMQNTRASNPA